jgi:uncharacterized protein YrrD
MMRIGKELLGKPIYSLTNGQLLGSVKDLYLDSNLETVNGVYLGSEGLFSRKARFIERKDLTVLGLDAVLASNSDVVMDSGEIDKAEMWLRREDLQGREIETPGGTKVGTVGDVVLDDEANIIGFALARVHVSGPVAENRAVMKDAVLDTGGVAGKVIVDLSIAEQPIVEQVEPAETDDIEIEVEQAVPDSDETGTSEEPGLTDTLEETESNE